MSLKGSPVSSKLLICIENGTSMSAAPTPQTNAHVYNVRIQRWLCFVDDVSSRTKV